MANQQFKDYVTSRTEDTAPDITADMVPVYDASATTTKKVKPQNLVGTVLAALRSAFVPASASSPASLDLAEDTDNGSHKVTISAPSSLAADRAWVFPDEAGTFASRAYADALVAGLSWKQAVRAATTANGTLASAFENGDTVDGVTLATGDRILIKNQSTASENGIYTVNASGAPTRATDADSGAELVNASVYVQEGTANADKQFVCTTNATITIGSTNITFVEFSSGSGIGGSTGATDNAILRADGAGGSTAQSSLVTLSDDGIFTYNAGTKLLDFDSAGSVVLQFDSNDYILLDNSIIRIISGGEIYHFNPTVLNVEDDNFVDLGTSSKRWKNFFSSGYHHLSEMTAPGSAGTNAVRIYAEDNGSGKTRLMAIFQSGAAQQLAIEP